VSIPPTLAPVGTIVPGDRGRRGLAYTLLTPPNRYLSRIPSLPGGRYYKLVTPRLAPARFGMYFAGAGEQPASVAMPPGFERFLIGMGGRVTVRLSEREIDLTDGGFIYLGTSQFSSVELAPGASVIGIKRHYEPFQQLVEPGPVWGKLSEIERTPTVVDGLNRRELLDPLNPSFDFNVTHMEFDPNVALAQIEIHDEEHGLYMTSGGGLYHLDGDEHQVEMDDFIYMAPYCPQGFKAGPEGGSYLLYKDVYRDGF
jgi:(S)-ureidoglycine aminohydrolase